MIKLGHAQFPDFLLPDHDEAVTQACRECVVGVLDGEYSYPRETPEDVRTIVDVGCNLGAFIVWARTWWPNVAAVYAYEPNVQALSLAMHNAGDGVAWHDVAVTTNPTPFLCEEAGRPENWGGVHTLGVSGTPVPAIHPRDLPPCDALKVDCEGCEKEVFEHYRHWDGVKVVMFEYHRLEFREPLMWMLRDMGFTMRRGNPNSNTAPDTQVWTR